MDKIEFRINKSNTDMTVAIIINQIDLISAIKEYELPFAKAEGSPKLAGAYMGLQPDLVLSSSSRHFLGEPHLHYDDFEDKIAILACSSCGESLCWPLLVRIKVNEKTMIWEDFSQPYREKTWNYDSFGPFEFDRTEYERSLLQASFE